MIVLLTLALCALVFAQTELTVGSALVMSLKTSQDVDICPVKIVIPESRAGATCALEIRAILTGATFAGGLDLSFYWKKDSAAFADADKLPVLATTTIENKADCKTPGTYYLGVKVAKCSVCTDVLNIQASFDLDVAYRIDGTYQVDLIGDKNEQSAWMLSKANDYVYVNFALKDKGTPHFNIDKCVKCAADNYDYFYGKKGTDFKNATSTDRITVMGDAANLVKLPMIEPGEYVFAIFVKSVVGTTTEFRFQYSLNEKTNTPYPSATCPMGKCSLYGNCPECARNKCNWCEGTRTCGLGSCTGNDTVVTVEGSCFKIGEACGAIKNCGDCADRLGCVWCNSLAGIGIEATGTCSAGKYDNGVECTLPTATAVSERAKCPGGGGTTKPSNSTDKPGSSSAGVQSLSAALLAFVAAALAL